MLEQLLRQSAHQEAVNSSLTAEISLLSAARHSQGFSHSAALRATPLAPNFSPAVSPSARETRGDHVSMPLRDGTTLVAGAPGGIVASANDSEGCEFRTARPTRPTGHIQKRNEDGVAENPRWMEQTEAPTSCRTAASQRSETDELKAVLQQTIRDLKDMRSQVHHATSKAPDLNSALEEARVTPFTKRSTGTRLSNPGKLKLPIYDGRGDPTEHIRVFSNPQEVPVATKKMLGTSAQHEESSERACNYQINSPNYGRERGRGRRRAATGRANGSTRTKGSQYDESAYCNYHKIGGHSTANCKMLAKLHATNLAASELMANVNISNFQLEQINDAKEGDIPSRSNKQDRQNDSKSRGDSKRKICDSIQLQEQEIDDVDWKHSRRHKNS